MDTVYFDGCLYASALIGVTIGFTLSIIAIVNSFKGGDNDEKR